MPMNETIRLTSADELICVIVGLASPVLVMLTARGNIRRFLVGSDNRLSLSKFQILVWTFCVIAAYSGFVVAQCFVAWKLPTPIALPSNLLVLLGLTGGTTVAAKAVTASQVSSGTTIKLAGRFPRWSELYLDDNGESDLSRAQLLWWTLLLAGVFLLGAFRYLAAGSLSALPNVDEASLALMGISQGTYIAKKVFVGDGGAVVQLMPSKISPGTNTNIVVTGSAFGAGPGTVMFGGANGTIVSWTSTTINVNSPILALGTVPVHVLDAAGNPIAQGSLVVA